jgi:hypothetical protein
MNNPNNSYGRRQLRRQFDRLANECQSQLDTIAFRVRATAASVQGAQIEQAVLERAQKGGRLDA